MPTALAEARSTAQQATPPLTILQLGLPPVAAEVMHVSLRRSRSAVRPASLVRALAGQAAASWWEVPGVGGRQIKPEQELQGMSGGYLVHDALVRNGVRVVFGLSLIHI